jgi:NAD(P)-dependent dehydrogenase (short-subunit alcohol dehydrogenase family)
MSNVFLFGGTSEIGLGIAQRIKEPSNGHQISRTYLISRGEELSSNPEEIFISWSPKEAKDIEPTIKNLPIGAGDIAIISLGSISVTRWESDPIHLAPQELESEIFVNAVLPITVLIHTVRAMIRAGGGKIVVLSSVSAFPPLTAHLFYGTSKNLLDRFSQVLAKEAARAGVQIVIVRPGFVKTKLHGDRKFSFLPTSIPKLSNTVVRSLASNQSQIIWVPRLWSVASKFLALIPGLAKLANRALLKSI